MKNENISVIKNELEIKSIQNIHVFLNFAYFYQQFIQSLNEIASLPIFMFKISVTKPIKSLLLVNMAETIKVYNNANYETIK